MADANVNPVHVGREDQPAQQGRRKPNNDTNKKNDIQPRTGGLNDPTCMDMYMYMYVKAQTQKSENYIIEHS
jgi:hypothetical protein